MGFVKCSFVLSSVSSLYCIYLVLALLEGNYTCFFTDSDTGRLKLVCETDS